ncbi:MAG: hypothetical protein C0510_01350 [Erythrobacter sp.]|nr:hypothetical protein [Erythrobacter sp.]
MSMGSTVDFGNALFGMLADIAGDIILKTDNLGFIEGASPGLDRLGFDLEGLLIAPHIADLADLRFAGEVRDYCRDALGGTAKVDCIEFPLARAASVDVGVGSGGPEARRAPQWFALRLRRAPGEGGNARGALAMLRSIEGRRSLEDRLLASALTDHLTGLGNRRAYLAMLSRHLAEGAGGVVAMIDVDSFRALNLRFGPASGDEMICAFADFLRVMLPEGRCLARLGGARFAFFLPDDDGVAALDKAEEIVRTFAALSHESARDGPVVTASAGLAMLDGSLDQALANAERALILAKAAGGTRAELAQGLPYYLTQGRLRA